MHPWGNAAVRTSSSAFSTVSILRWLKKNTSALTLQAVPHTNWPNTKRIRLHGLQKNRGNLINVTQVLLFGRTSAGVAANKHFRKKDTNVQWQTRWVRWSPLGNSGNDVIFQRHKRTTGAVKLLCNNCEFYMKTYLSVALSPHGSSKVILHIRNGYPLSMYSLLVR